MMYRRLLLLAFAASVALNASARQPYRHPYDPEEYAHRSLTSVGLCTLSAMGSLFAMSKMWVLANSSPATLAISRSWHGPMAYLLYSALFGGSVGLGLWGIGKMTDNERLEKVGKILAAAGFSGTAMSALEFRWLGNQDISAPVGLSLIGGAASAAGSMTACAEEVPADAKPLTQEIKEEVIHQAVPYLM
jgi:hypothetical protein